VRLLGARGEGVKRERVPGASPRSLRSRHHVRTFHPANPGDDEPALHGPELVRPDPTLFQPRYNIAPTQSVLVIRSASRDSGGTGCVALPMRWGLIPSWSKSLTGPPPLAVSEGAVHVDGEVLQ